MAVCHLPNVCLNACGVSPKDGQIYCQAWGRDGRKERQLVRVNFLIYSHVMSKRCLMPERALMKYKLKRARRATMATSFDQVDGRFLWRTCG